MLAAREEQGGGIADLCEPFALHGENADLVHRAKAVLEAAQDAILVAALALEAEHDIDHMLQHARAGDGAILGDMAHQHQRHAIFLGIADEFEGTGAHLADGARRALDLVGMHGLDRIDHQQRGRLHAVQRGENVAHRGGGGQLDRRLGQPQPVGPQAHLPGRFLAADVDRRLTGQGQLGRRLQQQGGFADARIAAHENGAARHDAAAQRPVQLGNARQAALQRRGFVVQRLEHHRAATAGEIVLG